MEKIMPDCLCLLNFSQLGELLIILFLLGCAIVALVTINIHAFLAKTAPIDTDTLVLEGWLPDYAIEAAMQEFKQGSYCRLVTIGSSIHRGSYLFPYKTFAELTTASLIAMGLDEDQIITIPLKMETTNRTYGSATELKEQLALASIRINSFNLFTLGTHSRRSWILYKKAFEPETAVGIIAATPLNYNTEEWWKSSEGSRTIFSECIAYLYTRIFISNAL
jgi:DUF218 domain